MAGNRRGGLISAKKNKAKYGNDFYVKLGRKGGALGTTGGFYANRELASTAGRLGGMISRRGSTKISERRRREIKRAYAHLLKINNHAERQRSLAKRDRVMA